MGPSLFSLHTERRGVHAQAARPFAAHADGKMGYIDFVWFILSEEDKSNDVSLEYWFKCVDLDCDGCLSSNEMLVHTPSYCQRLKCGLMS